MLNFTQDQTPTNYKGFTIQPNNNDGGFLVLASNGAALTLSVPTITGAKRLITKHLSREVYEVAQEQAQRIFAEYAQFMSYAKCDDIQNFIFNLISTADQPHAEALEVARWSAVEAFNAQQEAQDNSQPEPAQDATEYTHAKSTPRKVRDDIDLQIAQLQETVWHDGLNVESSRSNIGEILENANFNLAEAKKALYAEGLANEAKLIGQPMQWEAEPAIKQPQTAAQAKLAALQAMPAIKKAKPAKRPTGLIMYEGASMLDGAPIVVVATLASANAKTGDMVQTWILRTDLAPVEAVKSGQDAAICGACPHRPSLNGACYVNVGQAPSSIYKSFLKGNYAKFNAVDHAHLLQGRAIRFGAYGDPAAAPVNVWAEMAALASLTTGYTHQRAHKAFNSALLDYVMLSADTPRQALAAHAQGLRTFRVRTEDSPLLPNEIECLSDSRGLNCIDCGLCDSATAEQVSIAVTIHGAKAGRYVKKYAAANIINTVSL